MNTFNVYLARSGHRLQVTAQNWRAALKATGRPDACLVDKRVDLLGRGTRVFDLTFGEDNAITITARDEDVSDAEVLSWVLDTAALHIDYLVADQRGMA